MKKKLRLGQSEFFSRINISQIGFIEPIGNTTVIGGAHSAGFEP